MTPEQWWKNFALGTELDAAGAFVYNGIKSLHDLSDFYHPVDTFEVLYNLSVGIERALKVAIVLLEHQDSINIIEFEASLKSHSTTDLANRVDRHRSLNLSAIHRELLSLLSDFYKRQRYGRYSLSTVPNIAEEKVVFLEFLDKHLRTNFDPRDELERNPNSDRIRKFIGKVVQKICKQTFQIIGERAAELNIFTDELHGDTKAVKVFLGERLDFVDEEIIKKELLIFLMNLKTKGSHIDQVRSINPLELDSAMTPVYIQALLCDLRLPKVAGEVEEFYYEIPNVGKRLELVSIIDDEYISYSEDDDV